VNRRIEAGAAVEEVNCTQRLRLAIPAYDTPDQPFDSLIAEILLCIEERQPTAGTCVAVFPTSMTDAAPSQSADR
jgi:hypothetical protein